MCPQQSTVSEQIASSTACGVSTITCNLCGGTEIEIVGNFDRYGCSLRTVLCPECGLVWTDPRPTPEQTRQFYARDYRREYKNTYEPKLKHAYRETLRALARIEAMRSVLTQGQRVLDVGSGGGFFIYALQNAGVDACGIEPNHGFFEYSVRELQVPVQNVFLQDAQFPAESFDIITLHHVLEHLEDPVGSLERLSSWVRPEGHLVVEVPNIESMHHAPQNRFHVGHLYHFNPWTLEAAGRKIGLEVHQSSVVGSSRHCLGIFRRPTTTPSSEQTPRNTDNAERVRELLRRHTVVSHYTRASTYFGFLRKNLSYLVEFQRTRSASSPREIVDRLIRRAA